MCKGLGSACVLATHSKLPPTQEELVGAVPGKSSGEGVGLNDHFALACEDGPAHLAIGAFLGNVLETGKAGDLGIAKETYSRRHSR